MNEEANVGTQTLQAPLRRTILQAAVIVSLGIVIAGLIVGVFLKQQEIYAVGDVGGAGGYAAAEVKNTPLFMTTAEVHEHFGFDPEPLVEAGELEGTYFTYHIDYVEDENAPGGRVPSEQYYVFSTEKLAARLNEKIEEGTTAKAAQP